ncbi:MAG: DUF3795 domain-containing protein [Deltaproteobacteria bacterium]|nr:DUF3795 domain-containing protein [Deltaproteobacteria bacterium]
MREMISHPDLVAFCGLYCGACRSYLKERCPGCHDNQKATWCKVRLCCMEKGYSSCAVCKEFTNPMDCRLYNHFISKIFGMIFRSDRAACIAQIKKIGLQAHADDMAKQKRQSIRR